MSTKGRAGSKGARAAASYVLGRLIEEQLVATIESLPESGGGPIDVRLKNVFHSFPRTQPRLDKPCASINDAVDPDIVDDLDDGNIGDEYDTGTSRRLTGVEMTGEFSVDLWCNTDAEREAFQSAFSALFAGDGFVVVDTPTEAIPPAFRNRVGKQKLVVRLTLSSPPNDVDDEDAAMREEWRANARVEWDAELLTAADCERLDVISFGGRGLVDVGTLDAGAAGED